MTTTRIRLGLALLTGGFMLGGCLLPPPPGLEIIVDDGDPEVTIVSGDWDTAGADDGNGAYGDGFLYDLADRENVGIVRFAPNITYAGTYTVYIYWSADTNRTTDQPVIVHDATGDTTYRVNLQENGNQWCELGEHWFNAGTGGYLEFNTATDEGYCNADAVRLVAGS